MNKNIVWIAVLIIVLAVGGLFLYQNSQKNLTTDDKMAKSEDSAMKKEDSMMENKDSRYLEYSKAVFDNSSNRRRAFYFYANWCPTCRPLDTALKTNSNKIPEDVVIIRVNYNDSDTDSEEKNLAKKYAVTYQHTFVQIDSEGNEVAKWSGGQMDEVLANIK